MAMTSTSRYAPAGSAAAVDVNTSGSTAGSGTSSQSGTSTSSTSGTSNTDSTSNSINMDKSSLSALNKLIAQLQSGGTAEMKQQRAVRDGEINTVQGIRAGYSKDSAFNDAQGLMAIQMRRTMEQLIPSINRAAEGAGSSGGALRALLLQDAAAKAAEASSAAGLNTAVQYGGIQGNLSGVLEGLTRSDPAATEALLAALGVAKGAVTNTTGSSMTSNNSTTVGQTSSQGSTSQQTRSNESKDYAPSVVNAPVGSGGNSLQYFGPSEPAINSSKYIGTTADTLAQLTGGGNPWAGYTSF